MYKKIFDGVVDYVYKKFRLIYYRQNFVKTIIETKFKKKQRGYGYPIRCFRNFKKVLTRDTRNGRRGLMCVWAWNERTISFTQ